jgi:hypothetical protein
LDVHTLECDLRGRLLDDPGKVDDGVHPLCNPSKRVRIHDIRIACSDAAGPDLLLGLSVARGNRDFVSVLEKGSTSPSARTPVPPITRIFMVLGLRFILAWPFNFREAVAWPDRESEGGKSS